MLSKRRVITLPAKSVAVDYRLMKLDQMQMPQELSQSSSRNATKLWIGVLILLIGAILRLAAFDETLILADQSAILDAAFQVAHLRYFPIIGMKSSAGVMQTGIVPLLAAIPLFFVKRIIAVQWFFSVLDVLTLAWLYRAVRKSIGNHAAWIAALLYATAPWVILYTRTIWFQTLIATFATVTFASILLLLKKNHKKPRILVLAMVSTTMMSMVHLAAAPWGVLMFGLYIVIARRQRLWRSFWWGIATSGALVLPYVVYLVRSSFKDIAFILKTGAGSQGLNTTAYRLSKELISGAMIVANARGDLWDRSVITWDRPEITTAPAIYGRVVADGSCVVFAIRRPFAALLSDDDFSRTFCSDCCVD